MCYTALLEYMQKTNKKNSSQKLSTKQKVLLPSLKERQRYAVYVVSFNQKNDNNFDFREIHEQILTQVASMMGIFDGANAGIIGVKYSVEVSKGIIRVDNKYVDKLKVCLSLIKNISIGSKNINVAVECEYVSGLLNKAEERLKKN